MYSETGGCVNDTYCFQVWSGTLVADRAQKLLVGTPRQLGRASSHSSEEIFAHDCIIVGQFRWSIDHSRGDPSEMRAARDVHTVSGALYHSCAPAGLEVGENVNVLTDASLNGCHVCFLWCNEIAHFRLVLDSIRCREKQRAARLSDREIHGVRVVFQYSASVILDSRRLQLRATWRLRSVSLAPNATPSSVETSSLFQSTTLLSIQVVRLGGLN